MFEEECLVAEAGLLTSLARCEIFRVLDINFPAVDFDLVRRLLLTHTHFNWRHVSYDDFVILCWAKYDVVFLSPCLHVCVPCLSAHELENHSSEFRNWRNLTWICILVIGEQQKWLHFCTFEPSDVFVFFGWGNLLIIRENYWAEVDAILHGNVCLLVGSLIE